jgi:hypothetical protein
MLFDISLLPLKNLTLEGIRDKSDIKESIKPITFYDHFVTKGHEYIIVNVQSVLSGAEKLLRENAFTTIFTKPFEKEQLFLAYRETSNKDTFKQSHDIVICVYFIENTNSEIELFFDYYFKQGIEKIFMFYCGKLEDRPNLPQRNFVEYFSWDYSPFWILDPITKTKAHYVQIPLYNVFAKKISPHCNWTIFCDLDEYIFSNTHKTIKAHLNSSKSHLFTNHRWAKVDSSRKNIKYENKSSIKERGKNLLKGNLINPSDKINIHQNLKNLNCEFDENLLMFHNILANKKRLPRIPFFNRTLFWKKVEMP